MSLTMRLYRQEWAPTGSGDARSIENAMGRTKLDMWNVLLREALQNSWDARIRDNIRSTITFSVSEFELPIQQTEILLEDVFGDLPPEGHSKRMRAFQRDGRIRVLCISDTGTRGLGGPIRADVVPKPGERSDFADFVRNFGRSTSKGLQGGTFGLGKGVLYSASEVGVCLIYSQTRVGDSVEARLIGVSGGDEDYSDPTGKRFTGRNWWGVFADDGVIDPMTGASARLLAQNVGMPVPDPSDTGTTIMIISPKPYLETEGVVEQNQNVGPDARVHALREAAIKWAWPHALDLGSGPSINFAFSHEGAPLAPIEPLTDSSVKHFAFAYRDLIRDGITSRPLSSTLTQIQAIRSERPSKHLGLLAVRHALDRGHVPPEFANTVALMRGPRMIVKYDTITTAPAEGTFHAVFLADEGVDHEFAESEPVAHDDWVPVSKQRGSRNLVRICLDRIRSYFRELTRGKGQADGTDGSRGLTRVSSNLGTLIGSFKGQGLGGGSDQRSLQGEQRDVVRPSRRAQGRIVGKPQLLLHQNEPHVAFTFRVIGGRLGEVLRLVAQARVVLDGSLTESDKDPLAGTTPKLAYWLSDNDPTERASATVVTPSDLQFTAVFSLPRECAVSVELALEEMD